MILLDAKYRYTFLVAHQITTHVRVTSRQTTLPLLATAVLQFFAYLDS